MSYVPVKGFSGLVRDTESNAIINVNEQEIELARERKRINKMKREKEKSLEQKVETLENDISQIKRMLEIMINNNV